jgi:hypothetical protein
MEREAPAICSQCHRPIAKGFVVECDGHPCPYCSETCVIQAQKRWRETPRARPQLIMNLLVGLGVVALCCVAYYRDNIAAIQQATARAAFTCYEGQWQGTYPDITTEMPGTVRIRVTQHVEDRWGQRQVRVPLDTTVLGKIEGDVKCGQERIPLMISPVTRDTGN